MYAQGANATYQSVRKTALTTQIQDEIKENIQKECDKKKSGKRRPEASKLSDISSMVSQLEQIVDNIHGRQYESFSRFKDVFSKVNVTELYKWISKNKERLSFELL